MDLTFYFLTFLIIMCLQFFESQSCFQFLPFIYVGTNLYSLQTKNISLKLFD